MGRCLVSERRIINTWDQVGPEGVYISRAYIGHRTSYFYGWQVVVRLGEKQGYAKTEFPAFRDNDRGKAALARAKAWAERKHGIKNWKRNALGEYVDADAGLPPLEREKKK